MALEVVWKSLRAKIGAVELDASVNEEHGLDAEVTAHTVEDGVAMADHVRKLPDTITINGLVTNTPFESERLERVDASRGAIGPAQEAFEQFRRLVGTGTLVTVVTRLNTYRNMAILSMRFPRDAKTGDALRFAAQLKEVRTVKTQYVDVRVKSKIPGGFVGPPNLGTQVAKPATQAERSRSILHRMFREGGVEKVATGLPVQPGVP